MDETPLVRHSKTPCMWSTLGEKVFTKACSWNHILWCKGPRTKNSWAVRVVLLSFCSFVPLTLPPFWCFYAWDFYFCVMIYFCSSVCLLCDKREITWNSHSRCVCSTLRRYVDLSKDDARQDSGLYIPLQPDESLSKELQRKKKRRAVSYTHLTLPTTPYV